MEAMKGKIEDCTIGPVPVNGLVEILRQLRESAWDVRFVAFSGMIAVQEKIALSRPVPLPSYLVVAEKFFGENEEFVPPKIKMGGTL